MAALLADICASTFYHLAVHCPQQEPQEIVQPPQESASIQTKEPITCNCASVLALVSSTRVSHKQTIIDQGTTVVTMGVKDLLSDDGCKHTLASHCTTDTHTDFKLTPAKRAAPKSVLLS